MAKGKKALYGIEFCMSDLVSLPLTTLNRNEFNAKLKKFTNDYNEKKNDKQYDEHHFYDYEKVIVDNKYYTITIIHFNIDFSDTDFYIAKCKDKYTFNVTDINDVISQHRYN